MSKVAPIGTIGLIRQTEDGRVIQIGMTHEQMILLQIFLSGLSQKSPLVELGEECDLVLKSSVCKRCKKK